MSLPADRGNIIIVDDTPANLRLLEGMLSERGYEVRPFPKGSLALKAAEKDPPDLILLDVRMPEMDGYQVCLRLKANERLKDIPVIFVSALTDLLDKVEAFKCGGVDYVTKPFHAEEVSARVETHLKLRRYRTELEARNERLRQTLEELRATQMKLVQSEKMASLGVLTAGIAHEINNPVNFITSGISGLRKVLDEIVQMINRYDQIDPAHAMEDLAHIGEVKRRVNFDEVLGGARELINTISVGAARTAEIIKGLRLFSRLDENDQKPADLHENLDSTLLLLSSQYRDAITIEKDYGEIPLVVCSQGKINQVFMNILVNAVEAIKSKNATSTAERITIKTSLLEQRKGRFVEIEIRDTGPGMADEVRKHIFDPFFTTKAVGKGTGLGLPISLGIIEGHEGSIDVESRPGEGASFRIRLPVGRKHG